VGLTLIYLPTRAVLDKLSGFEFAASRFNLTEEQIGTVDHYKTIAGLVLAVLAVLIALVRAVRLKSTYYEVSGDRIEWARGILQREIDNLDLFRVVDLRLQRSLLDCMVGVGQVVLVTTDKSDPEFRFEKIRGARRLYDILKEAYLAADRDRGVVHLE